MREINIAVPPSKVANSMLEGKEFAQQIGFPLVIRPSYTLEEQVAASFIKKKILNIY